MSSASTGRNNGRDRARAVGDGERSRFRGGKGHIVMYNGCSSWAEGGECRDDLRMRQSKNHHLNPRRPKENEPQ